MSGKQIDWDLLKELECPVCGEYMASPISMCEKAHSICGSCKERLSNCPSCTGEFKVWNVVLEKLAATAAYPCKNREAGCGEIFTLEDKDKHLAECLFQSRECPFRKLSAVDCTWSGTLSDIPAHIKTEHYNEAAEVQGHFKVTLPYLSTGRLYQQAVLILGELFYLTGETKGDAFSFGVYHFGLNEETEAFKYSIKIGNSEEYVTVTRKCLSYLEGGLKDLQPEKYVKLYYDTILKCLSENTDLSCEIEIGREKLDGFVSEELQEFLTVVCVTCSESISSRMCWDD
jgi:E3 ubiquitin-protein ligase SIAH1